MKKLFLVLAVLPMVAFAQEKLSLQQCINMALSRNLSVAASQIALDRAKALQGSSFDLPPTEFALIQDPTSGGSPDNAFSISQSFDFPTVYVQQRKYLVSQTVLEQKNLEASRNEVVKEVIGNYYLLLHAAEVVAVYEHRDSIYQRFAEIAERRLAAGETGRLELMNAQSLKKSNYNQLLRARAAYSGFQLVLQGLVNSDFPVVPSDSRLSVISADLPASSLDFSNSPAGQVAAAKISSSERNLALAKQEYLPSFNFTVKTQAFIKSFNPYNIEREKFDKGSFMGFEVGLSVPLVFGSRHAKAKAANREVELAKVESAQSQLAANQQYQQLLKQLDQATQTLAYYNEEACATASEMARIAQLEYEHGEVSYIEYMQNQQSALQVHLEHLDAINDYNQIIISLNYLQGYK